MDTNRLSQGQMIAGASGVALFIIMFIGWWGAPEITIETAAGEVTGGGGPSANAWEAANLMDLVWAVTAIAAIALAGLAVTANQVNLPVAMSAIVAGLGILSLVLIVYRLIDPPFDADREIGAFLGLLAIAGIAYGGWTAMQEEGTSFGDQGDRLQGNGGGTAPPPPPPPTGTGGTAPPPPPPPPTGTGGTGGPAV